MALNTNYNVPFIKGLTTMAPSSSQYLGSYGTAYYVRHGEVVSLYLAISSEYKTFQFQWRRRRRYKPSAVELASGDVGGDVWEDFPGTWTGDTGTSYSTPASYSTATDKAVSLATFTYDYDTIDFDEYEYEVRVRAYNSPNGDYSEWAELRLHVRYMPHISGLSYERGADGNAILHTETTYERPEDIWLVVPDGPRFTKRDFLMLNPNVSTIETRFPVEATAESFDIYSIASATISDEYIGGRGYVIGPFEAPSTLPEPSISQTVTNGVALIEVEGNYTDVDVSVSYEDCYGVRTEGSAQAELIDGKWTVSMPVPFDVEVTIAATVRNAAGYAVFTKTFMEPSDNWIVWTYMDEVVRYKASPEVSDSFTLSGGTAGISNLELPVSVYGINRTVEFSVSFESIDEAGDSGLSGIRSLLEPHDWVVRTPGGRMSRVRVDSVSTETSYEYAMRGFSGQVSMMEVTDELG